MTESLATVLERLQTAANVDLAAIVSMDGFLVESAAAQGPDGAMDAEEFAAVATNGLMVAQALGREIDRGGVDSAILEYERGTVIINALDEEVALVMLAGADINLGRLRLLARRYRDELVATASMAMQ